MAPIRPKNKVWEFYDVAPGSDKMAVCKLCHNEYSFRTTVFNLKKHLKHKHSNKVSQDVFEDVIDYSTTETEMIENILKRKSTDDDTTEEYLDQTDVVAGEDNDEWSLDQEKGTKKKRKWTGKGTRRSSALWHFFEMSKNSGIKAECRLCKALLSYKTSISNLKNHLANKHPDVLKELDRMPNYNETLGEDDDNENGDQTDNVSCKDEFNEERFEVLEEVMVPDNVEPFDGSDAGIDDDCVEDILKASPFSNDVKNKITSRFTTPIPRPKLGSSKFKSTKKPDPEPVDNWSQSCEKFGSYAASLMLQIPRSIAAKYQVQIIQKLMDVALKYEGETDF